MIHPPAALSPGDRYGRLIVLEEAGIRGKNRVFLCRCDCGTEKVLRSDYLRGGDTRSCGCLRKDVVWKGMPPRHGHARSGKVTPTYRAWTGMLARCHRPTHPKWEDYGGRGIAVCDRWRNSFEAFLEDMGERPDWATGGIDRIDNDAGYERSNCRWATAKQQRANQRNPVAKPCSPVHDPSDNACKCNACR